jgi:hypothetical protein
VNECGDFVEASEIKAAREQLILKRSQIIKELRTRGDQWREFEQVYREIVELETVNSSGNSEAGGCWAKAMAEPSQKQTSQEPESMSAKGQKRTFMSRARTIQRFW